MGCFNYVFDGVTEEVGCLMVRLPSSPFLIVRNDALALLKISSCKSERHEWD